MLWRPLQASNEENQAKKAEANKKERESTGRLKVIDLLT